MPAQILSQPQSQENIEQLKAQLKAELDECVRANSTGRNHVMDFMLRNGIWHISNLDYPLRVQFQKWLEQMSLAYATIRKYLLAYDRIKQYSEQQRIRLIADGKSIMPAYKNEILFLPHHPDLDIARRFENAINKEDLVWDFTRNVPESLKRQVFDILHCAINNDVSFETTRVSLLGLQELYDFCSEEGIADIEQMNLYQINCFIKKENTRLNQNNRLWALNFCRKAIFMHSDEIHWNAPVWYMERIHLQPERIDNAHPANLISFLEVTHLKNRDLLQQYAKYGIGLTNLSINCLRHELVYIKRFLAELNQSEEENVCMITPKQMDEYLQKERYRDVQAETYNKQVMSLLHFFVFLKVHHHIEQLPFDADYYLMKTQPYHHDRSVSKETADEILEKLYAFPENLRLMFLHLWGVGLRISEVCALKGDAYYIQGQDTWIQIYQTKMRNYKRIPIPTALFQLMQIYLKKHGIKADSYVFQGQKGGAYQSITFLKQMQAYCKKLKIQNGKYKFRCHDYRHTLATYFYDAGVPLQSIRDYLGHVYEEMTQQYVDYMPKRIEKANEEYFSQHRLAVGIEEKEADNTDGEQDMAIGVIR